MNRPKWLHWKNQKGYDKGKASGFQFAVWTLLACLVTFVGVFSLVAVTNSYSCSVIQDKYERDTQYQLIGGTCYIQYGNRYIAFDQYVAIADR